MYCMWNFHYNFTPQFAKFHSHKTVALETDICYVVGDDDPEVYWDPFFITFSGLPTRISGSIEISAPTRCPIPRAKRRYCGKKNPLKAKRRGRTSIDRDRKIEIRKDKFKSGFFCSNWRIVCILKNWRSVCILKMVLISFVSAIFSKRGKAEAPQGLFALIQFIWNEISQALKIRRSQLNSVS